MKKESSDGEEGNPKKRCEPPFDFFGISPNFYINGKEKTVSCAGFVCSILLMGTLASVSFYYALDFIRNNNFVSSTSLMTAKEAPVIDLDKDRFLVAFRANYPESLPYFGLQNNFFTIKFFKTRQTSDNKFAPDRKELPVVACEQIRIDWSSLNQ